MERYSKPYIEALKTGPFPHQLDPWAEMGRYFHQLHGSMIDHLLGQIQDTLLERGYIAGRETSLQIAENKQPDIYIHQESPLPTIPQWDYVQAAEGILVKPGLVLEDTPPELDALFIKDFEKGELVTIVEIISPSNKTDFSQIQAYRELRAKLMRGNTNVVEVDLTRSVKRMVLDKLAATYPYHVAIHLCDQSPRFIGLELGQHLEDFALPLRGEVIGVALETAYRYAYHQTAIAAHIQKETGYDEAELPFPSLLPPQQRASLLQAVGQWQNNLAQLRAS